ncbi:hypothetical protein LTR62_002714 [Meristemomyces frigidus]|uniref:Protein kinase domain-containing protein n=1 Tax=Meristemomyces frigidus TaxID=1508187 RepID=A0AAN7TFH2_9PEZI|nr:hypothetical protein LTR62_002714 [Meristemomyces frigidus]
MAVNNHVRIVLARGWTSTIYVGDDIDKNRVVKALDREDSVCTRNNIKEEVQQHLQALFKVEQRVYEQIAVPEVWPPSLLRYYGTDTRFPRGLVLERAPGGSMFDHLHTLRALLPARPPAAQILTWARQVAEALHFLHNLGILHCDIHTSNFFLDREQNLKLADFGAASIDGEKPLLLYRRTHQRWIQGSETGEWRKDVSVAAEIFAFGCAVWNIEVMRDPFQVLEDREDGEETVRRLQAREMPETEGLVLRRVVEKCWREGYENMGDVLEDIEAFSQVY